MRDTPTQAAQEHDNDHVTINDLLPVEVMAIILQDHLDGDHDAVMAERVCRLWAGCLRVRVQGQRDPKASGGRDLSAGQPARATSTSSSGHAPKGAHGMQKHAPRQHEAATCTSSPGCTTMDARGANRRAPRRREADTSR